MEWELKPRYDRAKSFYKKAKVKEFDGKKVLQSYSTDVAEITNGVPFVRGTYSQTTTRHIKEFLRQQGFKADTSKQMMKDYGELKNKVKSKMNKNDNGTGFLKTVGTVAMMGDIFAKTPAEKNAWKVRMLKAGLQNRGLDIPEDFDKLSEKERKRRLDGAIGELMK